MQRMIWGFLLFCSILLIAGCGNIQLQDGAVLVDVNLNESQVNDLVRNAAVNAQENGRSVMTEITNIEFLGNNTIRVNGTSTTNDGTTRAGSFDMMFGANNGALSVQVTNVNLENLTMDSPVIQRINERLAEGFARAASESENVSFQSVEVTDNQLIFQIRVEIPEQQQ